MKNTSKPIGELESLIAELFGVDVISAVEIAGGRNSRVYRLLCKPSLYLLAKFYHRNVGDDGRERLFTEVAALDFMWKHGLRDIPRVVASNELENVALFDYIEGSKLSKVSRVEVDAAVDFLLSLQELRGLEDAQFLPPASEACFALPSLIDNIEDRLERLSAFGEGEGLGDFLKAELSPHFEKLLRHSYMEEPFIQRVLSPSDFGFHNAILRTGGGYCFVDFEYFGWDDPAKMISDFVLHPGMEMENTCRRYFVSRLLRELSMEGLARRFELFYHFFAFKWCLILLNEFLPAARDRRCFAASAGEDLSKLRELQLAKAKRMLENARRDFGDFPYGKICG